SPKELTGPTSQQHESKEDDSYSIDNDFARSTSQMDRNILEEVVSPSSDSPKELTGPTSQQHESKEECDEFTDDVEQPDSIHTPSYIEECKCNVLERNDATMRTDSMHIPSYISEMSAHQEKIEECKHDRLEMNDTGARFDHHTEAVSSLDHALVQRQLHLRNRDLDEYEYIGEVAPPANDNPMLTPCKLSEPTDIAKQKCSSEDASKTARQHAQTQTQQRALNLRPPKSKSKPKPMSKPASFVPRCAYAQTKSMKMRSGVIESKQEKSTKAVRYCKKRLEQLAKPVKHHVYEKENIQPEGRARKSKKKSLDNDDSDDGENFFERMENREKQRQQKLARAAAEALYDARVDKKACPKCGTIQSYDEMIEGQDNCKSDCCKNGKHCYLPPKRFVLKNFEQRMERSAQRRSIALDRIEGERSIIHTSQRMSRRQKELQEKVVKGGGKFDTRMAKDIEARKSKIQHLEKTRMELLIKEHSFKPKLNVSAHMIRHRKGGWDSLAAPLRRYTEEYQPPQESRKKKTKRSRRKPLESP
ncbi:hypothetical protein ACHAXR_001702, partial [Thalassiosira sp. AJA248-18]